MATKTGIPLRLSYQLFHVDERERLTNDFSLVSLIVTCEDLNYFERESEFKSYIPPITSSVQVSLIL